jgi:hypothetical protein
MSPCFGSKWYAYVFTLLTSSVDMADLLPTGREVGLLNHGKCSTEDPGRKAGKELPWGGKFREDNYVRRFAA